jgi:hypothetical protein
MNNIAPNFKIVLRGIHFFLRKKKRHVHLVHHVICLQVRDDTKPPGDNANVLISKWSSWRFDSRCEIFSLLDGGKLGRYPGSQELTHRKVGSKLHPASRGILTKAEPTDSNSRRITRC